MKQFLFICFLIIPITGFCQAIDIPKFSNAIIARHVGFKQLKDSLIANGYIIDKQDHDGGTLVTMEKSAIQMHSFGVTVDRDFLVIMIRIKDSTAIFTAKWRLNVDNPNYEQWNHLEYWKDKTSVAHVLFLQIDKIARSISKDIGYAKI